MREEEPIAVAGSLVTGESGGIEMRFESILQMKKHASVVERLRSSGFGLPPPREVPVPVLAGRKRRWRHLVPSHPESPRPARRGEDPGSARYRCRESRGPPALPVRQRGTGAGSSHARLCDGASWRQLKGPILHEHRGAAGGHRDRLDGAPDLNILRKGSTSPEPGRRSRRCAPSGDETPRRPPLERPSRAEASWSHGRWRGSSGAADTGVLSRLVSW